MQPGRVTSKLAPLRISDNGRYFLDRQGRPFFWLGDTLWHLFRSLPTADVKALLQRRKEQGFSVALVMLIGWEPEVQPNLHGEPPWHNDDPAQLNERYFELVDAGVQAAAELDMIQILGVYHKAHAQLYTPDRARESARWIAQRYRDVPQLIWSIYPEAKPQYTPTIHAIVEGLQQGDGGAHWITVHPDPSPQSSSGLWHHEPWLPFNMLQACTDLELVYAMTAADYAFTPVKPAVMAEGGYEGVEFGRVIPPLDIRRQAYWSYLAGGHFIYGHGEDFLTPGKWREWIDSPGANQLTVLRRILTSLPRWWDVLPDQSIIAKGVGEGMGLNAAMRAGAGDWALVYLSGPCTVSVRMDRIKTSETVAATWIDPRTGDRQPIGTFGYAEVPDFTTPAGWEDALVLLEAA